MKLSKLMILVLTFLLSAIAVVFGVNELGSRNFPFSVIVTSDGCQEELQCMKLRNEYYIFLPSYGTEETARIKTNLIYDVSIDGKRLTKGQSCADFPENTKLELYFRSYKNEGYETITFVRSDNVATMYIDVPSGNMEHIHKEKGNAEPGSIRIYREDGSLDYAGSLETIKGRGNATWVDDKKSYSLELSQEADVLDMGKARKWILLSNSYDPTHLRNKLAYDMAEAANMAYSPESIWVDLYLNGEYAGLYLLSERNEVHGQRVNIDPQRSFLVALEPDWRLEEQGYPYVQTQNDTAFRIHYSSLPLDTVQQIWQSAENAIFSEDGYDPISGKYWDEIIHMESWVQKYLLEETLVNEDVGLASEYFYYDAADGLIYAGPVWDMDVSLMDAREPWLSYKSLIAGRPHLQNENDRHFFYELLQKQAFRDRVRELYRTDFRPLLLALLNDSLEEYAQQTAQASLCNQVRWNLRNPEEKVLQIAEFLRERIDFLDSYWLGDASYSIVQVKQGLRVWAYAIPTGGTLEDVPDFKSGTWCWMETGEEIDKTLPINDDVMIYLEEHS